MGVRVQERDTASVQPVTPDTLSRKFPLSRCPQVSSSAAPEDAGPQHRGSLSLAQSHHKMRPFLHLEWSFDRGLRSWWLMAAPELPVLKNRWKLFFTSALQSSVCKCQPLTCSRALWKRLFSPYIVQLSHHFLGTHLSIAPCEHSC